ncbi:hypothetical protein CC86DRAFT_365555 [Ophiobolus disseminans]|uniref:Mid2 domain-containing protein n=1 Tax=Ophiobolus disseminans TaxID=1469910 RepID=A0A6A7AKC2_9PLEO|nr:hypothetical protein CC86DRAFT_365555 [Ophiobolus disseminans]
MAPHTFPTSLPYSMLFPRQNNDNNEKDNNSRINGNDDNSDGDDRQLSTGAIVGIVVAFLVAITIAIIAFFLWRRNRRQKQVAASKVSYMHEERNAPTEEEHMMTKVESGSAGGAPADVPAGARQETGTVDVPPTYQAAVSEK